MMNIDQTVLNSAVAKAQKYLSEYSRLEDIPIRFELHVTPQNRNSVIVHQIVADVPNPPVWGWPVLSTAISIKALQTAIEAVLEDCDPKSMVLAASGKDGLNQIIQDFIVCSKTVNQAPVAETEFSNLRILRRNEIAESIKMDESKIFSNTRTVIAVSVDSQIFLDNENHLGEHLRYSMDGSKAILWLGTIIDNYPSPTPEDIDTAVNKEIDYTGRGDTVLIVSGDIVDSGDGRALVKNAHLIDSAIVD